MRINRHDDIGQIQMISMLLSSKYPLQRWWLVSTFALKCSVPVAFAYLSEDGKVSVNSLSIRWLIGDVTKDAVAET